MQFDHRVLAYLLVIAAVAAAVSARRTSDLPRQTATLALAVAGLVLAQAGLGVLTLVLRAPLGLALAHQCLAAVVLASALGFAWRVARA